MSGPTILPYVALQPDFSNVFADIRDGTVLAEDIYLSGYQSGSASVHGKVNVSMSGNSTQDFALEARDGVNLKRLDTHTFAASVPALGIADATLRVPKQTISFNNEGSTGSVKRISTFDVSPDANLVASGHLEGDVSLQGTSVAGAGALSMKRQKVHLSTVLSLRFFPSSKVLLSASSDLSLNIISADPSPDASFPLLSVARTLKGHKSAVTDTHIVGVGRTVYSCGKDGSIRLWDVAEASKAGSTLASEGYNPMLKMAVDGDSNADEAGASVIHAALQNGTFNIFDARASRLVYASPPAAPARRDSPSLLSIASDPLSHTFATGSAGGIVNVYDSRQLPTSSLASNPQFTIPALSSFKRSDSSIDDLSFVHPSDSGTASNTPKLLVATGDGFPFQVSLTAGERPIVVEEYAAHADEGVRSIRISARGDVWTAGDDGLARRY